MTNSIGTQNFPHMHFNMVRIGLNTYKHVMSIKTRIISIKKLKEGDTVGYNKGYTLTKDSQIAVLEMGYADGIPTSAHQGAHVSIQGKQYPIVGIVCMDMTFVDLGEGASDIKPGDYATLSPTELSLDLGKNLRELSCSFDRKRLRD